MKTIFLMIFIFIFNCSLNSQVPQWMIIDLQELILYDRITDIFNIDLNNQEILEISVGKYGSIWWTTQDYKFKYLPNNLVIYSQYDLENPLYFFPCSPFSITYYSRIDKKELADRYPINTWVKYDDPDSYKFAMWTDEEKSRKEFLNSYELENYSFSIEKEISLEEVSYQILTIYPELWFELANNSNRNIHGESIIDVNDKLYYRQILKAEPRSVKIFDTEIDANGNLWIATGKRLFRFNGVKFFEIDIPAISLENDFQQNLWIGTTAYNSFGSLVKFDGTNFTFYNSLNSPLPENDGVLDLKTDDRGNLWIALKRMGLPDKLENIKVAVFNQSGVDIVAGLTSLNIWSIRKPVFKDLTSLFLDEIYFRLNIDEFKPFSKVEFFLDDNMIYSIKEEEQLPENLDITFSYFLDKPDKYLITVYLYDLSGSKVEMANVELNLKFNEKGFFLGQNEPNPFSNFTIIEYGCWECKDLVLNILDKFGRIVIHNFIDRTYYFSAPYIVQETDFPNGIYYYYLKASCDYPFSYYNEILDFKKMVLFNPKNL